MLVSPLLQTELLEGSSHSLHWAWHRVRVRDALAEGG